MYLMLYILTSHWTGNITGDVTHDQTRAPYSPCRGNRRSPHLKVQSHPKHVTGTRVTFNCTPLRHLGETKKIVPPWMAFKGWVPRKRQPLSHSICNWKHSSNSLKLPQSQFRGADWMQIVKKTSWSRLSRLWGATCTRPWTCTRLHQLTDSYVAAHGLISAYSKSAEIFMGLRHLELIRISIIQYNYIWLL